MSGETTLDSRYSWLRLCVTLAIALIGNVGMWAVIVILPAMQAEFGVDRAAASLPYTLTMVGFALGNLVLGRAVDRFGVTRAVIGATLLLGAGFVGAALSGGIVALSVLQFAIGFGSSVCFGPLIADISHWFFKRRGIAVALVASGNYLSGAIWPLLLAGILAEHGWRVAYMGIAGVSVVTMIPLALLLRRSVPVAASDRAEAAAAQNRRSVPFSGNTLVWLLGVAGIGCCVAMSMPQVHIVAYCVDLGYGPAVGAEMLSLMLFGGVISRIISGLLSDRLGGVVTLLLGSTCQMIALFLYLPFDGLVPLYVISAIFGLSQGGIVPAYAVIVRDYLPAKEAGAKVGFVMMTTILGMAIGGWMSGWIYDLTGSYMWAFVNGIGWNGLNVALMIFLLNRSRRGPRAVAA